ncbi:MAG: zinc-ribbon domain-containing protein [Aeromicrobium sp.]
MRAFSCRVCGNKLYVENTVCVVCRSTLAFSRQERDIMRTG